ncbi:MAG: DUF2059 domain-containing protein [Sedimenticola sp.]
MKSISILLTSLVIFFSVSAQAETANREQLLRFANAVGMYDQIEEQKVALNQQGAQAAQQYAQQIAASTPGLPEQFEKDLSDEMAVYMSNISTLIDTDFAVNTYLNLISKKLTMTDVEKLTEFYESNLGKKYTQSNKEVMGPWTVTFMGDFDKKLLVHLQTFTSNLMAKASSYSSGR